MGPERKTGKLNKTTSKAQELTSQGETRKLVDIAFTFLILLVFHTLQKLMVLGASQVVKEDEVLKNMDDKSVAFSDVCLKVPT